MSCAGCRSAASCSTGRACSRRSSRRATGCPRLLVERRHDVLHPLDVWDPLGAAEHDFERVLASCAILGVGHPDLEPVPILTCQGPWQRILCSNTFSGAYSQGLYGSSWQCQDWPRRLEGLFDCPSSAHANTRFRIAPGVSGAEGLWRVGRGLRRTTAPESAS
jgi:hypothetical protein